MVLWKDWFWTLIYLMHMLQILLVWRLHISIRIFWLVELRMVKLSFGKLMRVHFWKLWKITMGGCIKYLFLKKHLWLYKIIRLRQMDLVIIIKVNFALLQKIIYFHLEKFRRAINYFWVLLVVLLRIKRKNRPKLSSI